MKILITEEEKRHIIGLYEQNGRKVKQKISNTKNLLLEEGESVSIMNNGKKLSGKCVKGDCKNGLGNATFSDGSKYSGNWVGGNRTYGKFFDKSDVTTYTGTWSGGLKNGNFTEVYNDSKAKGFGKYVNDKEQGKWSYTFPNGVNSVITYNNGKETYYSDSGGYKTSTDAAGNYYQVDSKGTKTSRDAAGNVYQVDPDGTKRSTDASGNEYRSYSSGEKQYEDTSGNKYDVFNLGNGQKRYNSYNTNIGSEYDYAIEKRKKSGGGFEYYSGSIKDNEALNGNGKVCRSLDETTMVLGGCVSATFLNGKRVYKDTNASGLNKCSRYTDCSTKTTNDKYFKCDSCEKIGTLQACLKIKNPNLIADKKWGPNTDSVLSKLGYSGVSGITDTDITKICGGTSEAMPVSERDLNRIVKQVIKEQGPAFVDMVSGASNFGINIDPLSGLNGNYGCQKKKSSYDLVIELFNLSKKNPSTIDTQIKNWVSRIYTSMGGIGISNDFTKVLSEIQNPKQLGAVLIHYYTTYKNYLSDDLSGEYTITWDSIWNKLKKFQSTLKIDSCAKYNTAYN